MPDFTNMDEKQIEKVIVAFNRGIGNFLKNLEEIKKIHRVTTTTDKVIKDLLALSRKETTLDKIKPLHSQKSSITSKLTQLYYDVPDNLKFSLLVHLLNHEESELVMVFCNTRTNTDFVASNLKALGIGAMTIHGGLTQDKRDRIMKQFHSHDVRVLVCTDVAARGLDIPPVSHIYNYDIPMYGKDYIHRIGRTARAGKDGVAINILASRDYDSFRRIMKSNEVTITEEKLPDVKKVRISRMNRPKRTFRPGRRPHSN